MSLLDKLRGNNDTAEETNENTTATSYDEEWHHEKAKEDIKEWKAAAGELLYCELCNQVFVSGDVFSDHRLASEHEIAREWVDNPDGPGEMLPYKRTLSGGDEFPDGAMVGRVEPCEPDEAFVKAAGLKEAHDDE